MNRLSIKNARILANMNEKEACTAMNIKRTQLIGWEFGSSIPSYEHAVKMSEVYGIPLDMISFQKEDNTVRFDTSALRSRIINQYGTIKAFADAVDMSPRTLASRLNDHTEFTASEIEKITIKLNLTGSEVNQYFFTQKNKLLQLAGMFLEMTDNQKRMLLAIMNSMTADPESTKNTLQG